MIGETLAACPGVDYVDTYRLVFGEGHMPKEMVFRQLFDTASSTFTYLLGDPQSRQAVIIDPVFEQHLRDRALIEELGLTLAVALDTHCHADHVTGTWLMQQATGCRIGISGRYDTLQGADLRLDHGDPETRIWRFAPRPVIPTDASPMSPVTIQWLSPATPC